MSSHLQSFSHTFRWNAIEAIAYQTILFCHQLLLFRATSLTLYGLIGTLFSLLYMSILIANAGLETSLGSFFTFYTSSKQICKKFMLRQLIAQSLVFALLIPFWCFIGQMCVRFWQPTFSISCSLLLLVGFIAFLEGTKKNLKTILHLAFFNKDMALLEITTMCAYTTIVWITYCHTKNITLYTIFLPMAITSALDVSILTYYMYARMYQKLPALTTITSPIDNPLSWKRIIHARTCNWLNQLSTLLFSSNFLVPFFSAIIGLSHAAIFRLISSITYFITTTIHRLFGTTSITVLAQTKHLESHEKQAVFASITKEFNHILYGIIIFSLINYHKILHLNGIKESTSYDIALLFFLMNIIEQFFVAYEKFMISEEKAVYILLVNMISIFLATGAIYLSKEFSATNVLIVFIFIRLFILLMTYLLSLYCWNIRAHWHIDSSSLLNFIFFSLTFFVLFSFL